MTPIAHVQQVPIVEAVYGIGTVEPDHTYQLKVAYPAVIERLYVQEGDRVARGDLLAVIEKAFSAPFSGVVTQVSLKENEMVAPQLPVLTIQSDTSLHLEVSLDQQAILKVRKGMQAKISFEGNRDKTYDGVVRALTSKDGQFVAWVDAHGLPEGILPLMSADVAITIRQINDAICIPLKAIKNGAVYLQKNQPTPVTLGIVDDLNAQVLAPHLKAGTPLYLPK